MDRDRGGGIGMESWYSKVGGGHRVHGWGGVV